MKTAICGGGTKITSTSGKGWQLEEGEDEKKFVYGIGWMEIGKMAK